MANIFVFFSQALIPLIILVVLLSGLFARRNIYEDFVEGAKDGIFTAAKILPTLAGLMIGVGILRASGFLDLVTESIGMLTEHIHFPSQLVPLAVVKMFSSSAATGLLLDLFEQYGADSRLGVTASLMLSSTETIFYTMSIYFMSVKIKRTRWTLAGALVSSLAGIAASTWLGMHMGGA